jgi:hypothetical protein
MKKYKRITATAAMHVWWKKVAFHDGLVTAPTNSSAGHQLEPKSQCHLFSRYRLRNLLEYADP